MGAGLSYKLPRHGTVDLDYIYTEKSSNFDTYDYKDNRVTELSFNVRCETCTERMQEKKGWLR
ncbi:MAG: hypothetical protein KAR31_04250 [Candidatus Omnitrophica bacterium]|nr:hypothetical protein [Candidatus Omnitrophota bacterium]